MKRVFKSICLFLIIIILISIIILILPLNNNANTVKINGVKQNSLITNVINKKAIQKILIRFGITISYSDFSDTLYLGEIREKLPDDCFESNREELRNLPIVNVSGEYYIPCTELSKKYNLDILLNRNNMNEVNSFYFIKKSNNEKIILVDMSDTVKTSMGISISEKYFFDNIYSKVKGTENRDYQR